MKLIYLCVFAGLTAGTMYSQNIDTLLERDLEPVFISAHRDGRKLSGLSASALYIPQEQIKQLGSFRLQQVLSEQTGIQIVPQVNGLGSGIQLQGFNPDYTLILIDGEPLIGRNTGLLDLNRISLNPIKQIEIVKGPSSSLYGSEALAGVVNIITERTNQDNARFGVKMASNSTSDAYVSTGFRRNKSDAFIQLSRFATEGYDLSPDTYGKTVSPHQQWSFYGKFNAAINQHEFTLSSRYFKEHQQSEFLVNDIATSGSGLIRDWMINPVWKYKLNTRLHSTLRAYYTQYAARAIYLNDQTKEEISKDDFHQSFSRLEWNPKYLINDRNSLLGGVGAVAEKVNTIRYGNDLPQKQFTQYGFIQYTWQPAEHKEVNLGFRYDHNNVYGGQLSPKVSFITRIYHTLNWKGSVGLGFKSPDFRQLYLDFTNAAGGGYSVFGREVLAQKLEELEQQGQIAGYLKDITGVPDINPERSISFNSGVQSLPGKELSWELNYFRHEVSQLIETEPVAQLTNGSNLFSYFNINKVRIQGLDINLSYPLVPGFRLQTAYQLLYAHDRNQLELLGQGLKFRRDPVTLSSIRLKKSEYFGLSNRSRHSFQVKLNYQPERKPLYSMLRFHYRSKFGLGSNSGLVQGGEVFISEQSGNDILDQYDAFVKGYTLVNLTMGWRGLKNMDIQVGADNILNKTIPEALPGLAGRTLYINLSYSIFKRH